MNWEVKFAQKYTNPSVLTKHLDETLAIFHHHFDENLEIPPFSTIQSDPNSTVH